MTKLSFQLFSARDYTPWQDVFSKLANAGFKEVEGFGPVYGDMNQAAGNSLAETLSGLGLSMPTGHFSIDALESRSADVIAFAKAVGMESIYCPYLLPDQRPTDKAGWVAFGARLEKAGEPMRDAGFDFGWHNHDFEFATFDDGSTVLEAIFEGGPSLSYEADIAWIVRGKADPAFWIEKFGDRITSVHVKDIAPEGTCTDEGGWADLGYGVVDWKTYMPLVKAKTKAAHFVIEHDNPNDLDRVITRSIASFNAL